MPFLKRALAALLVFVLIAPQAAYAASSASYVWRDYVTDGVPGSGPNPPAKSDIRAWGLYLEALRPIGSVSKRQVLAALADATNPAGSNRLGVVNAALDPLGGDAASLQWLAGSPMSPSDALYTAIQTATGWSGGQMTTFFTLAQSETF